MRKSVYVRYSSKARPQVRAPFSHVYGELIGKIAPRCSAVITSTGAAAAELLHCPGAVFTELRRSSYVARAWHSWNSYADLV